MNRLALSGNLEAISHSDLSFPNWASWLDTMNLAPIQSRDSIFITAQRIKKKPAPCSYIETTTCADDLQDTLPCRSFDLSMCQPVSIRVPFDCRYSRCASGNGVDDITGFCMVDLEAAATYAGSIARTYVLTCAHDEPPIPAPAQALDAPKCCVGKRPTAHPVCGIP